jgi:hypothetical protein
MDPLRPISNSSSKQFQTTVTSVFHQPAALCAVRKNRGGNGRGPRLSILNVAVSELIPPALEAVHSWRL